MWHCPSKIKETIRILQRKIWYSFLRNTKNVVDSVVKKWVFGWEKKGFVGKKNPDLWKRFLVIFRKNKVDFKWIKGHNNHPQNERCDELAVMASMQKELSIDVFYEKEEAKLL